MWSCGHQECSENEERGEAETTKETEKSQTETKHQNQNGQRIKQVGARR